MKSLVYSDFYQIEQDLINYNENIEQTGQGIIIGVVDSAFNGNHPSLKGSIIDINGRNELPLASALNEDFISS